MNMNIQGAISQLREGRKRQGLSLKEVACRMDCCDAPYLSRLENGKVKNPTIELIIRYANALGVEITFDLVPINTKRGPS